VHQHSIAVELFFNRKIPERSRGVVDANPTRQHGTEGFEQLERKRDGIAGHGAQPTRGTKSCMGNWVSRVEIKKSNFRKKKK
jgi:hypothetical protein